MYTLADRAAMQAARRLQHNCTPQDIEDMRQEAALAIWHNLDRGENYTLVCGRNAALKWWRHYVAGWSRNDAQPQPTPQSGATAWPTGHDGESLAERFIKSPDEAKQGLPPEILLKLVEIFIDARAHGGDRTLKAAMRDAQIVGLLCQGATVEGIAHRLSIPIDQVSCYRTKIRRVLRAHLKGDQ